MTIFSKNSTPFVYLPMINSTPFTYLVYNFAPLLTAVNALSSIMNKSKSQKTFSTFSHQQHSSVARLSNFTVWNNRYPYLFIYLKPEKGTHFGGSLPPPPGGVFLAHFPVHCPLEKASCLLEQGQRGRGRRETLETRLKQDIVGF